MLTFIHRYRRVCAAFLLTLTLIFVVDRARAQALPAASDAFTIGRTALQTAVAAWGTAALIVNGTGGVATVAGAGGAVLGLTPIGWAAIGLAVVGAVILTSDSAGNPVAVTVGTQSIDQQPLPDMKGTTQPSASSSITGTWYALAPANGGVLFYISGPASLWTTSPNSTNWANNAVFERFSAYVKSHTTVAPNWVISSTSTVDPGYTPNGTYFSGKCPTYAVKCAYISYSISSKSTGAEASFINNLPLWAAAAWTYGTANSTTGNPYQGIAIAIPVVSGFNNSAYDCGPGSSYDYMAGLCVEAIQADSAEASDNKCNVSWGSDGCPVYNKTDPDCGSVSFTMSCGTLSLPPSFTVRNPSTGESMVVTRPILQTQGTIGQVEIKQSTPDPVTNTTNIKTTVLNGPVIAPGQTPAPGTSVTPVSQGAQQQVAPGTGAGVGKVASDVTVLNWPKSIEISNMPQFPTEMKCSNCEPVNLEVPADSPAAPPVADAQVLADSGKFMDPLKTKFAGLLNFELPAHAAGTCPKLDINWDAWGLKFNLSNNTMCTFLEEHRSTIQSVVNLAAIVAAIIIVLGA